MPSGLIQIAAYGYQDLFLTGTPQITFFKSVYKKHTNFAIESIKLPIQGTVNFDTQIITTIPKNGDLLYRVYIEITLPSVNLINESYIVDTVKINELTATNQFTNKLLLKYNDFFKYNFIILNGLLLESKTVGASWFTIKTLIQSYITSYQQIINNINIILDDVINLFNKKFPESDKQLYVGSVTKNELFITTINELAIFIKSYYKDSQKKLLQTIFDNNTNITNIQSNSEYFAWIEKIGFYIFKKISLIIGPDEIVNMDGDYMNIFYQLNNNYLQTTQLEEMIGNVPDITTYSNIPKKTRTLLIPIPLWFNFHNGNALPLVSMLYHDVELYLEFNSLENCCFYNGSSNINNLLKLGDCNLIVEYIFLDNDERIKYAQYSHEYLIQSVQTISSEATDVMEYSLDIDFYHPIKDMFWIVREETQIHKYKLYNILHSAYIYEITSITITTTQEITTKIANKNKNLITIKFLISTIDNFFKINDIINIKYSKYYDGKYSIIYVNNNYIVIEISNISVVKYATYPDTFYGILFNEPDISFFNPISTQQIIFKGENRTVNIDSMYYNYIIPYTHYNSCPNEGINVYTFSLHPYNYQCAGSCNFSLIKSKILNIKLNQKYYKYITNNKYSYKIKMYGCNYNILRIHNGIGTIVFSS